MLRGTCQTLLLFNRWNGFKRNPFSIRFGLILHHADHPSSLFFLFALLVAGSTSAQTLEDLEFGTPESLDIATWNIEWFPKNGSATIDRVKAIVQNLEIDLWAIQEIDDTTVFKGMIEDLDDYDYILMDGWFGGLVYVYNSSEIEVLDAFEIYTESPFWSPIASLPLDPSLRVQRRAILCHQQPLQMLRQRHHQLVGRRR